MAIFADTIWDRIATHATLRPRQAAVLDGDLDVDYGRLAARAGSIASEIVGRGVAPGSLVGVCMGRSWELVATLVGILRAGCAYVPLDPGYPRQRVRYMLEHSRAAVAIVGDEASAALCEGVPEIVRIDEVDEVDARQVGAMVGPSATDLAYVIYTSGSTGRPKGVAIEHRNLVAMSRAMGALLDEDELSGVLAAATICFDTSVMEILGTLSLGGTLVLAESALGLLELPAAARLKTCIMVPSAMRAVLAVGPLPESVRTLVFGGEALKRSLVEQVHALEPRRRVVNVYGPTEDTVFSTVFEVPPGTETLLIGRPVEGTRAYVLDRSMRPVPAGETGELYLAGEQVARGYLHDEERTRERFVEPGESVPEERLYRTGDLCRWVDSGPIDAGESDAAQLEFLGRADEQVKLRGYRIELEEIEATLETMGGVDGAAATVLEHGARPMLVGYFVSRDEAVTPGSAREFLAERLPDFMVPRRLMRLDALPRLPNDKLDRKSLPTPEPPRRQAAVIEETAETEETSETAGTERSGGGERARVLAVLREEIAALVRWPDGAEIPLDLPLHDLGLDSLSTLELSARLSAALGRALPRATVAERSTVGAVAQQILEGAGGAAPEPAPAEGTTCTVSPAGGRAASNTLRSFQQQIQSCYAPFMAAKAPAWSATDKGRVVRAIQKVVGGRGRDPYSKLVRTGSGHRGTVVDFHTDEEREAIIWTTNLYLGLNRDPEVIRDAGAALERLGTGMGTSAAAAGVTDLHLDFEREFAALVGKPAACLFPTGYTANVGAVAGLLQPRDVVIMDQLCHASIVDGARLCGATIRTFRHNDPGDLEAVLAVEASPYRTLLVVLEGVYSMGEGAAPVAEIARTAKRFGALVLVDEAHSFGFYGPRGAGLSAAQGATADVDFIMTTLSKALGSLGGVVAASEEHVALLKAASRAYIFQASTSPADIAAALSALRRLREDDALRERLWDTTAYMRERFTQAGYDLGTGDGPIVTPHFGDAERLFAIVGGLYDRGIHASAVTYPIVEVGRSRLRLICSAAHTRADVDRTVEALIEAERAAEREADERLAAPADRQPPASSVDRRRDCVERWARAFACGLGASLADDPSSPPRLEVSIRVGENQPPVTLRIGASDGASDDDGPRAVTVDADEASGRGGAPSCSLLLRDEPAVSSLCASDAEGLLRAAMSGACELSGAVEPFIWLVGRWAERRPQGV